MKERPILFNAAMVRAILSGSKSQTRRAMKPQPPEFVRVRLGSNSLEHHFFDDGRDGEVARNWLDRNILSLCPYGQVGDRLWVRETWMPDAPRDGTWPHTSFYGCKGSSLSMIPMVYRRPKHCLFRSTWSGAELTGWKPSIHMPRWASRITLEITGVRVEKLQDISRGDAMAEGCPFPNMQDGEDPRQWYADLWESINGKGSWSANPWVWVIEFSRVGGAV